MCQCSCSFFGCAVQGCTGMESFSLLGRLPRPSVQQINSFEHAVDAAGAHRHHIGVGHHVRQAPVSCVRVATTKGLNHFLLPFFKPRSFTHGGIPLLTQLLDNILGGFHLWPIAWRAARARWKLDSLSICGAPASLSLTRSLGIFDPSSLSFSSHISPTGRGAITPGHGCNISNQMFPASQETMMTGAHHGPMASVDHRPHRAVRDLAKTAQGCARRAGLGVPEGPLPSDDNPHNGA